MDFFLHDGWFGSIQFMMVMEPGQSLDHFPQPKKWKKRVGGFRPPSKGEKRKYIIVLP